jgi:Glycosyl transferases group 1
MPSKQRNPKPRPQSDADPRIFYFCFCSNSPSGGNKHAYRHVDILNSAGLNAAIFHPEAGFGRLTWFENDTVVCGPDEFRRTVVPQRDFMVVPEDLGGRIRAWPGRKIIFNKNIYHGALALGRLEGAADPYVDPWTQAAFAVSDDNARYLRSAYPALPVHRLYPGIDGQLFRPRPLAGKSKTIVTNTKAAPEVLTLYHLLRARAAQGENQLAGWRWVYLEGCPERQVAEHLAEASIFVFLSTEEGFGRMPVEALSAGCVVVGYDVGPMRESLPEASRFRVGDFLGMAALIEKVAADHPGGMLRWEALVAEGRAAAARYSRDQQRANVLAAWRCVLDDVAARPRPAPARAATSAPGPGSVFELVRAGPAAVPAAAKPRLAFVIGSPGTACQPVVSWLAAQPGVHCAPDTALIHTLDHFLAALGGAPEEGAAEGAARRAASTLLLDRWRGRAGGHGGLIVQGWDLWLEPVGEAERDPGAFLSRAGSLLPGAKFLLLVRDPLDALWELRSGAALAPSLQDDVARLWKLETVRRLLEGSAGCELMLCPLEDLRDGRTAGQLAGFLGLREASPFVAPASPPPRFTARERAWIEARIGPLRQAFGYVRQAARA